MRSRALVIFAGDDAYSIGAIDGDDLTIAPVAPGCPADQGISAAGENAEPAGDASVSPAIPEQLPAAPDLAESVVATLDQVDSKWRTVSVTILAVPSHWCLPARIDTGNLPRPRPRRRRRRLRAMAYKLEEKLPLAAEDVAADFIGGHSGGKDRDTAALGMALAHSRVAELVARLETRGMRVDHICPEPLLALQAIESLPDDGAVLLGGDIGRIDVFQFADGVVASWRLTDDATDSWPPILSVRGGDEQPQRDGRTVGPLTLINVPPSVAESVANSRVAGDGAIAICELPSVRELALRAAQQLARGSGRPLVDFRRGALGSHDRLARVRGPLLTAGAAAIVLLGALTGVLSYRAHLYRAAAGAHHAELVALHRQVFPGQTVPIGIQRRLENHLAQLELAHGAASGSASDDRVEPPPGLRLLQSVLQGLPTDLRFTILELRLDGRAFTLNAQARSHGDADRIASALRRSGGLRVEAPRSQALRGGEGVGFTLSGDLTSGGATLASNLPAPSSAAGASGRQGEVRP